MAIITPGPLVASIRGSIGGTVFYQSSGGLTARVKNSKVNRRTNATANSQSIFTQVISAWRELSENDRNAWDSIAENPFFDKKTRDGKTRKRNGYEVFVGMNVQKLSAGMKLLTVPVGSIPTPNIVSLKEQFTRDAEGVEIRVTPNAQSLMLEDDRILVYASALLTSSSMRPKLSQLKLIGAYSKTNITNAPPPDEDGIIDVKAEYIARFGSIEGREGTVFFQTQFVNKLISKFASPEDREAPRRYTFKIPQNT